MARRCSVLAAPAVPARGGPRTVEAFLLYFVYTASSTRVRTGVARSRYSSPMASRHECITGGDAYSRILSSGRAAVLSWRQKVALSEMKDGSRPARAHGGGERASGGANRLGAVDRGDDLIDEPILESLLRRHVCERRGHGVCWAPARRAAGPPVWGGRNDGRHASAQLSRSRSLMIFSRGCPVIWAYMVTRVPATSARGQRGGAAWMQAAIAVGSRAQGLTLDFEDLLGLDPDVFRLALRSTHRLVDHHARVGEGNALAALSRP